ncbi:helix-turn-helix domain-containing protein [Martelella mediterranea]|uniref:helix-turn-helix domain-containing protein n=1 Tax=uncultured Martelella sp. TaxID=392331 RepID=UPI000D084F2D|nr:helix-turn-helix transcriptional regulator [uncultured Martelella sp.]
MDTRSFHKRLKEAADEIGGLNRLSTEIGVSRRTVGGWVSGETEPKVSACIAISDLTGVSVEWLLRGKGQKFEHENDKKSYKINKPVQWLIDETAFVLLSMRLLGVVDHEIDSNTRIVLEEIFRGYGFLAENCDLGDLDEVELHIRIVEHRLKKRLRNGL